VTLFGKSFARPVARARTTGLYPPPPSFGAFSGSLHLCQALSLKFLCPRFMKTSFPTGSAFLSSRGFFKRLPVFFFPLGFLCGRPLESGIRFPPFRAPYGLIARYVFDLRLTRWPSFAFRYFPPFFFFFHFEAFFFPPLGRLLFVGGNFFWLGVLPRAVAPGPRFFFSRLGDSLHLGNVLAVVFFSRPDFGI